MKKCINCGWNGEDKETVHPMYHNCPICGDNTTFISDPNGKTQKKKKNIFDINKDGKVDKGDVKTLLDKIKSIGKKKKKTTKRKKGGKK